MKNRVDPGRIVYAIEENFKDGLSKPKLRNLVLTSIAIGKTEKLKINEIANSTLLKYLPILAINAVMMRSKAYTIDFIINN